jgi:hypothetical protein
VDGPPVIGQTSRYLGVRPGVDLPVAPDAFVDSGTEGMSVVPPPGENLAQHRRPPEQNPEHPHAGRLTGSEGALERS